MHRYHFYLLGEEGEILSVVDRDFPHDEAATRYARALLPKCVSVDLLRGALVLGLVERLPTDPLMDRPLKPPRRWRFTPRRLARADADSFAGESQAR